MTNTTASPEQLTLLAPGSVPVQFRLDEATRRRGLAHVAEIRAQLAARRQQAATPIIPVGPVPVRRHAA